MKFEWDEAKHLANKRNHEIAFEDASLIFGGAIVEKVDERSDYREIRLQTLGLLKGEVIFVISTWRPRGRRIISARQAKRSERMRYYEALKEGLGD